MKKVIVTGGAGYIGSHTCVELYNAGYAPIIIDNFCNTTMKNVEGIKSIIKDDIPYYKIDCTNAGSLYDIFNKIGVNDIVGVIHFAAYKSVEESVKNPHKYFKNNIGSLEALMDVMSTLEIDNLIFSSSCSVYGNSKVLPVTEDTPFQEAESPYGETKQICERLLSESRLYSVSLRYFNPIGSHESSLIGDCFKDSPVCLVPVITDTASGKRDELVVYGNDYDTKDGTCIRDYIHVVDLAKSHVNALSYLIKSNGKHVFNVGTGTGYSVLETIKTFEKVNKIKVNWKYGDRRPGDVVEIYSDCTKVNKHLGWKSEKSLKDALKDAWNWELTR